MTYLPKYKRKNSKMCLAFFSPGHFSATCCTNMQFFPLCCPNTPTSRNDKGHLGLNSLGLLIYEIVKWQDLPLGTRGNEIRRKFWIKTHWWRVQNRQTTDAWPWSGPRCFRLGDLNLSQPFPNGMEREHMDLTSLPKTSAPPFPPKFSWQKELLCSPTSPFWRPWYPGGLLDTQSKEKKKVNTAPLKWDQK